MLLFHVFQYHVDPLNRVFRWYFIDPVVSWLVISKCGGSIFGIQCLDWSFQAIEGEKSVKDSM